MLSKTVMQPSHNCSHPLHFLPGWQTQALLFLALNCLFTVRSGDCSRIDKCVLSSLVKGFFNLLFLPNCIQLGLCEPGDHFRANLWFVEKWLLNAFPVHCFIRKMDAFFNLWILPAGAEICCKCAAHLLYRTYNVLRRTQSTVLIEHCFSVKTLEYFCPRMLYFYIHRRYLMWQQNE